MPDVVEVSRISNPFPRIGITVGYDGVPHYDGIPATLDMLAEQVCACRTVKPWSNWARIG